MLIAVAAGCMTGPTVQSIPSQAQAVTLEGYTLTGARMVRVECKQVGVRGTVSMGTTISAAAPTLSTNGGAIHAWSTSVQVPASCWVPVAPGVAATRVYATDVEEVDENVRMVHVEDLLCALYELDDGATPAQAGSAGRAGNRRQPT